MNKLIDPTHISDFNRTDAELELFWLFALCVAGKLAMVQAKKLEQFLMESDLDPFDHIRKLIQENKLKERLIAHGLGQYNKLDFTFRESLSLNLRTITVEELESIKGVGPKTARFFLLFSRPNQNIAAIDTHMLRFLRDEGETTLKTIPSGKRYLELEKKFIQKAKEANMSIADFDLMLWNRYSRSGLKDQPPQEA